MTSNTTTTTTTPATEFGTLPPPAATSSNPTVVVFGNITAKQATVGVGYSQLYTYLRTVFGTQNQSYTADKSLPDAATMTSQQRNALHNLLVSTGHKANTVAELNAGLDGILKDYKTGLPGNKNLTLYGMLANQYVNSGQWNTTPASASKHYFIPPQGTSYNPESNTFQVSPAGVTNPTGSSQASTLNSVELEMENWGFPEQTILKMTPRIIAAIAGGVDSTKGIDVWLREQPEYAQQFPGNIARMKQGLPPLSEATYTAYVQAMQEAGRNAGLPQGFLTNQEIGTLIANEVKPTEFTQRLTTAYEAVQKANPAVLQALQENFGLTPGHLAAWALDPHKATDLIAQQVQEAKYMAETQMAGFGQQMSAQQALALQQYQQTAGVSEGTIRSDIDTAARYQSLEGSAPGQAQQGLTQEQLIAGVAGYDPTAKAALDTAKAAQTAPFQGGGGDVMTSKGVIGAGFAQ